MGVPMNRVLAQRLTAAGGLRGLWRADGVRRSLASGARTSRARVELACSKTAAGSCDGVRVGPAKQEAADATCGRSLGRVAKTIEPATLAVMSPWPKRIDGLTANGRASRSREVVRDDGGRGDSPRVGIGVGRGGDRQGLSRRRWALRGPTAGESLKLRRCSDRL